MKKLVHIALVSAILLAPFAGHAESTSINPATTNSVATAKLDFSIGIPPVLFLRVGTGNGVAAADNSTVNSINFLVPAVNVGDGTAIAAAAADGDLGNGAVTVRVYSNVGTNVSLNSSVSGQLSNGNGDFIKWSEISVASAADPAPITGYTNVGITHPAFSTTSGPGTPTVLAVSGKLIRQQGMWTFKYANSSNVPPGTYGGTVLKNGQVTYTATQL
jgi:hypothetical protein